MRIIELDATPWKEDVDFYKALIVAIGKPKDYACNINALLEAMVWDYASPATIGLHDKANELNPPYTIRIHNTESLPIHIRDEINLVSQSLSEARVEYRRRGYGRDVDVSVEIVS